MTVVLTATVQRWIGVNSDTKPTAPPAGSTFYETDTGATSVYDGTAWQLQLDAVVLKATKTITYANPGTGAAGTSTTIFTVTGDVLIVRLVPFCSTSLTETAGTPTLALGVIGNTAILLGATTATAIDSGKFWLDTSPAEVGAVAIPAALIDIACTANIACLVGGTNNINAGVIRYDLFWRPLSSDGLVVAA